MVFPSLDAYITPCPLVPWSQRTTEVDWSTLKPVSAHPGTHRAQVNAVHLAIGPLDSPQTLQPLFSTLSLPFQKGSGDSNIQFICSDNLELKETLALFEGTIDRPGSAPKGTEEIPIPNSGSPCSSWGGVSTISLEEDCSPPPGLSCLLLP